MKAINHQLPQLFTLLAAVLLGAATVVSAACLKFDGVSSYVELNQPVSGDFTIECWFRSDVVAGSDSQWWQGMGLVDADVSGDANDFGLSLGNGKAVFGTGNPDTSIRSVSFLSDDAWHHVAATRVKNTGTTSLFVDGVLQATGTANTLDLNASPTVRIGSAATGINFFTGQLDEVRFWTLARAATDIAATWNRRLVGNEPGLVAYYPMEEGTGPTLSDASGHGFTGVLSAGVQWYTSDDAVGPLAVTTPATWASATSAQLNASVKLGATNLCVWFEWGANTNYGSVTPSSNILSSLLQVPVTIVATGLAPNTTYHYRAAGSNAFGLSYGADRTFTIQPDAVTTTADSGAGSLRQAIADAASGTIFQITNTGGITLTSGELVIAKDLSIAGPGGGNLAISGHSQSRVFNISTGATVILSGLTICDGRTPNGANGPSAGASGYSAATGGAIYNNGTLTLADCVLTNNSTGSGGAGYAGSDGGSPAGTGGNGGGGGHGGAIYNYFSGVLTLLRCTLCGNSTGNGGPAGHGGNGFSHSTSTGDAGGTGGTGGDAGLGAALFSVGVLRLEACTLYNNLTGNGGAGGNGGNGGNCDPILGTRWHWGGNGGHAGHGGSGGAGAAICADTLTLLNSTLTLNQNGSGANGATGGYGGAGWNNGSQGAGGNGGNGGSGGALYIATHAALYSSTIAYNATAAAGAAGSGSSAGAPGSIGYGGGVCSPSSANPLQIVNTILSLNTHPTAVPDDLNGAVASLGHNLVGSTSGSSGFGPADLVSLPPLLASLADNGGPTPTLAPWPESPVINAGANISAASSTDQRGFPRIVCSNIDIGALECVNCPLALHPVAQRALYFDGIDDYVYTPNLKSAFTNETVTIEVWFKARGPGVIVDERSVDQAWRDSQIEIVQSSNPLGGRPRISRRVTICHWER